MEHLSLFTGAEIPTPDSKVWVWSRSTLYRFMRSIGFIYGDKLSHYGHTKEREDIAKMRDDYLYWIEQYREEGYTIYYQDETWIFENMTCAKVWKDIVGDATTDMDQLRAGKGERSILCHIGCAENGLLDQSLLLFRGSKSKKSEDCHSEMNLDVFSDWYEIVLFPRIAATNKSSVVVLDKATYHTVLGEEDRRPVTSWNC